MQEMLTLAEKRGVVLQSNERESLLKLRQRQTPGGAEKEQNL